MEPLLESPAESSGESRSDRIAPRAAAAANCRDAPVLECQTISSDGVGSFMTFFTCCPLAYAHVKTAACSASIPRTPFESVIRYTCRVKQRVNYRMSSLPSEHAASLQASCHRMQSGIRTCHLHSLDHPQSSHVAHRQRILAGAALDAGLSRKHLTVSIYRTIVRVRLGRTARRVIDATIVRSVSEFPWAIRPSRRSP